MRILSSIKAGAEEILDDRIDNGLTQELSEFIDDVEIEQFKAIIKRRGRERK